MAHTAAYWESALTGGIPCEASGDDPSAHGAPLYIVRAFGYASDFCTACTLELLAHPDANAEVIDHAPGVCALAQLPPAIGLPALEAVARDNPHGSDWHLIGAADQGPTASELDRYAALHESSEGYRADYFYVRGQWTLGAN